MLQEVWCQEHTVVYWINELIKDQFDRTQPRKKPITTTTPSMPCGFSSRVPYSAASYVTGFRLLSSFNQFKLVSAALFHDVASTSDNKTTL